MASFILSILDLSRAQFLKWAFQSQTIRKLFISRANRLLITFIIAATFQFFLCLTVPIWILALGPLFFGYPHLFSVARYLPKFFSQTNLKLSKKSISIACLFLFLITAIYYSFRLKLTFFDFFNLTNTLSIESIILMISFFFCSYSTKNSPSFILKVILLASWILIWLKYLILMASFVLIVHNFIAFYFWICATKEPADRRTAILAILLFILMNTIIISGVMDSVINLFDWTTPHFVPSLDPISIGKLIIPTKFYPNFFDRGISLFALGQSLHYFIWLKAIPELSISQKIPLSFSQSYKALLRDLGPTITKISVYLSFITITGVIIIFVSKPNFEFFSIEKLRNIYLSLAIAHGYIEIGILPFISLRRTPI